jgi:hypothetical protein
VFAQPSLTLIGSFFLIVLGPAVAYLYLAHPDWMWHYILDGERVPRLAVVPVVALIGAALFGGYYAGVRVVTHFGSRPLLPIVGGVGAVVVVVLMLLGKRLGSYGGYADYHAGRALGLGQVKLGYALVALCLGVIGGCLFVGWELYRDSRKVRER